MEQSKHQCEWQQSERHSGLLNCLSLVNDFIHHHGYPWNIIWPCIFMVYTRYIQGYSWIFLAFWNQISQQASAAGLIQQCAHMCGRSRVFYSTLHHGNCAWGTRLQPTFALGCCDCCCGGCVAVSFLYLLVMQQATTAILVKDRAEGAFRAGDQCVEELKMLACNENQGKKKFNLQRW